MTPKIITLGGGMVGSAIARDLKQSGFVVTVADREESLKEKLALFDIEYLALDFSNLNAVSRAVHDFDLVIGAVPGFMGFSILKTVLQAGKNIADISFMPEDSREMDELAKSNAVTAVTDAGVAPGLSNLIFGKELAEFDQLETAKCYVGGLPQNPQPPWWYKSVFSPIDVIEEYTRPARLVGNGTEITKPAMSEIEQIEIDRVGTLDAFNSDGLRSLLNLPIPNMIEKTLRYSGHIQKIIEMRDDGLFNPDVIEETAQSLINEWVPEKTDYDQTIMRLEFNGLKNGNEVSKKYDLLDYYDEGNNITSMARTTGYTCSAVAHALLSGDFSKKGVFTMESFADNKNLVQQILNYLSVRNINFSTEIN